MFPAATNQTQSVLILTLLVATPPQQQATNILSCQTPSPQPQQQQSKAVKTYKRKRDGRTCPKCNGRAIKPTHENYFGYVYCHFDDKDTPLDQWRANVRLSFAKTQ